MPRSTTSRSCWRRPEAEVAVHILRYEPRSTFAFPAGWLCEPERRTLATLRGPRAAEWAASRAAAKACVLRLLGPPLEADGVEITKDSSGVPWAAVGRHRLPLSLAHSEGWAAAAAHPRLRVGVDVEPLRELPHHVGRYFLSPSEVSALHGWGDPPTASLAAWALKEAALKAAGRGLSVPPRTVRIRPMDSDGRVTLGMAGEELGAGCWREDGAVVAVACRDVSELPGLRIFRNLN
jgi:4'-phosphopantetheinyl transferase